MLSPLPSGSPRKPFRRLFTATWTLALLCATVPAHSQASPVPLRTHGDSKPVKVRPLRNSLGMTLVAIPAGEFQMGNGLGTDAMQQLYPHVEAKRLQDLRDEKPLHRVRITRSFYMGQHEVTVGQFREFLRRSGHVPESVADGTGGYGYSATYDPAKSKRGDAFEGRDPRYSWQSPGFAQDDAHPVVNITWHDAQALAQWLTKVEGRLYRLPTEAEWEYACKAGQDTLYPGSDKPADLQGQANVFDIDAAQNWPAWQTQALPIHDGHAFTAPVGRFKPNAFGLHDMVGNVWEWTADYHADDYYAQSPVDDPQGPKEGSVRVRRGGSWHTWPLYARCSYRNWNAEDTRYTLVGVRLVAEMRTTSRRRPR